jgi:hypothetical protein
MKTHDADRRQGAHGSRPPPGLILDVELPRGGIFSSLISPDFNCFIYMLEGQALVGSAPTSTDLPPTDFRPIGLRQPRTKNLAVLPSARRPTGLPAAVRSPRFWLIAMTMVVLIGGGLAISRATETQWQVGTPLSRLGVDDGAAGTVTFTLLGLGIVLLALGVSLDRTFASLRSAGRLDPRAGWLLTIGFLVAGNAVAMTGLFPIDSRASTAIHNLAGFTMPVVLMATMVGARLALGSLGRRFDRASAVILLSVIGLFVATARLQLLPYGLMELLCLGLIGAWLWLFEAHLRHLMGDL